MNAADFIRTFRTVWLRPGLPRKLTPEQERRHEEAQAELREQLAEMRARLAPLEPTRWQKLRRRLRVSFR